MGLLLISKEEGGIGCMWIIIKFTLLTPFSIQGFSVVDWLRLPIGKRYVSIIYLFDVHSHHTNLYTPWCHCTNSLYWHVLIPAVGECQVFSDV